MLVIVMWVFQCYTQHRSLAQVEDLVSGFLLDLSLLSLAQVVQQSNCNRRLLSALLSADFDKHHAPEDVQQAIEHAAASGQLDVVQRLWRYAPYALKKTMALGSVSFFRPREEASCTFALDAAAAKGHHQVVEWLLMNHPEANTQTALIAAAQSGHLQLVQLLCDQHLDECAQFAAESAAYKGHLAIVQYLCEKQPLQCMECALERAVCGGHFEVVTWLDSKQMKKKPPSTSWCSVHKCSGNNTFQLLESRAMMQEVTENGRMQAFEWLVKHRRFPQDKLFKHFVVFASAAGDTDLVQWLYSRKEECCPNGDDSRQHLLMGLYRALQKGHFEVAEFYLDRGIFPSALHDVVMNGHVNMAKALMDKYRGEDWCCFRGVEVAATLGYTEMVKLLDPDCTKAYSEACVLMAARTGKVDLLEFLLARHPIAKRVAVWCGALRSAIEAGALDAIKFIYPRLKSIPGAFDLSTVVTAVNRAAELGNYEEICFFLSNEPPGSIDFEILIRQAAIRRQYALIKLLHERNAQGFTTNAMDNAASAGALSIVRFLHEKREEGCTKLAMDQAAMGGFLQVVKFLHEHRHEGCTTSAMDGAAARGHVKVVKYLNESRTEGCTKAAMDSACDNRHMQVVHFLRENRREGWSSRATREAADSNNTEVIEYLLTHGRDPNDAQMALTRASIAGHREIVQWIVGHGFAVNIDEVLKNVISNGSESRDRLIAFLKSCESQPIAKRQRTT